MKVNKKILLLLPLLVVVFLLLWYAFQPAASTAEFLHNSVEYSKIIVRGGEYYARRG